MRSGMLPELFLGLAFMLLIGCYPAGGSGVSGQSSLAPRVVAQPQSQTVALAGTATFQVTGSGTPLPSYQWQRSNDGGATWTSIAAATGTSYALAGATTADNQAQFHVVLADPAGTATSAAATLSVTASVGDSQKVASLPPQSVPTGICTGPDGNLWFTNSGKGQIGKMDAITHAVSLVNLPNPACKPVGITAGPDGNLWFTEQVDGKIGVLTTRGVLNNEYPVGKGPTALVTGSDGNLWATLQTGNQIARMTPSGSVNLFALPTANASPTGITLAPDGSVWFSEQAAAQIARISPAGAVTEYALQLPSGGTTPVPVAVTATPDGNIYYSDQANDCIGRFSPTAQAASAARSRGFLARDPRADAVGLTVTVFFPLTPGADPNGLTVDLNGQVWVTEQGTGQVAEITITTAPGTTPVSYDLPNSDGTPANVVQGADGNIYVTQPGSDNVVMVVSTTPTTTVTVAVQPAAANLVGGGTQAFQAVVLGTPTSAVTWSVLEGASGGTITPDTGLYLAPPTAGTYHVVATSNAVSPAVTGTGLVTVTVPAISAITPANATAQAGTQMIFSAQVTGLSDNSVLWSASDGVMNPATGVWTVPNTAETVTITATSNSDSALSTTTLAVIPPSGSALPIITTMPANRTALPGATATFTVVAGGVTTALYQWQVSTNGGATWSNVAGATAASCTTAPVAAANDGSLYQVVIGNGAGGSVTSNAARLTVPYAPVIGTQPLNQSVLVGATATFSVGASGEPAPAYQWQVSTNGGSSYTALTGATSASYTTPVTTSGYSGNLYEVVLTNSAGAAVTSTPATLTLTTSPLGITTAPANQTVAAGGAATFTVAAYGAPAPAYQWQVSTDGGATWANVSAGSGGTTATYTTPATAAGNDGNLFEVVVTNGAGGSVTSPAAKLTVTYLPVIGTQPVSQAVNPPAAATFTVAATGDPAVSYQWQVSTDGGTTYANLPGANSASYTTGATGLGNSGTLYQVRVTNGIGAGATSAAATLTVLAPGLVITSQPSNQAAIAPAPATFTIAAAGTPVPTYQWQASTDGGSTWAAVGTGGGTYNTGPTSYAGNGTLYQVVVTSGTNVLTSSVARLSVTLPTPTQPLITAPASATAGATGLTASAPVQTGCTYAWSITNGVFTAPATGTSLSGTVYGVTFTAGSTGPVQITCRVTNAAGGYSPLGTASVAVVAVPPAPTLVVPANVAANASGLAASVSNPQANCTYTWSITGGVFTAPAAGTTLALTSATSVTYTAGGAGSAQLTCVINNALNAPGPQGTGTSTIWAAPSAPTVNAPPASVTAGTAFTASVSDPPDGYTYTWGVSGGTFPGPVTSITGGSASVSVTAGSSGSITLTCVANAPSGASSAAWTQSPATAIVAAPPATPALTLSPVAAFVFPATTYVATVTAQANCTYTWSYSGCTLVAGGTASDATLTFTPAASGTVSLSCYLTNAAASADTAATLTRTIACAPTLTTQDVQIAPGMGITYVATLPAAAAALNPTLAWGIGTTPGGESASQLATFPGLYGFGNAPMGIVPSTTTTTNDTLSLSFIPASPAFYVNVSATYGTTTLLASHLVASVPTTDFQVNVIPALANGFMAAGNNHNLQIQGGNIWTCGENDMGQLGNNTRTNLLSFTYVEDAYYNGIGAYPLVVAVSAAGDHSAALASDLAPLPLNPPVYQVYSWGLGQDGYAYPYAQPVTGLPTAVAGPGPYGLPVALATNASQGFALIDDGTVYCWAPGNGPAASQVMGGIDTPLTGIIAITATDDDGQGLPSLVALDGSGGVTVCNAPYDGTSSYSISVAPTLVAICARDDENLYGLDTNGTLWVYAPLFSGTLYSFGYDYPTFPGATGKCVGLAKGQDFILAIGSDQTVYSYGIDSFPDTAGQLGAGLGGYYAGWTQVVDSTYNETGNYLANTMAVAAGSEYAMALDQTGLNLSTWGAYGFGELAANVSALVPPTSLTGQQQPPVPAWQKPVTSNEATIVYGTFDPSYSPYVPDSFWIWGADPGPYDFSSQGPIAVPQQGPTGLPGTQLFSSPLAHHYLVIDPSGRLSAMGLNVNGQLGIGARTLTAAHPVPLANRPLAQSWLYDNEDGGSITLFNPTYPLELPQAVTAAAGPGHSLALDQQGNLWGWGDNTSGQLGLATYTVDASNLSTGFDVVATVGGAYDGPVLLDINPTYLANIAGGTAYWAGESFSKLACGQDFSVALTTGGLVFAWGANTHGQTGDPVLTGAKAPEVVTTQTEAPFTISAYPITAISAGMGHVLALDAHGQVYAWGWNQFGQLGNNGTTDSHVPIHVSGFAGRPIVQVVAGPTFSLALDNTGAVWAWGDNSTGVVAQTAGTPTSPYYRTPQTVWFDTASLPNDIGFIAATGYSAIARESGTNGSLYTWGWNLDGALGVNSPAFFTPVPFAVNLLNQELTGTANPNPD